jgi:CheY-like chemotaxis protein
VLQPCYRLVRLLRQVDEAALVKIQAKVIAAQPGRIVPQFFSAADETFFMNILILDDHPEFTESLAAALQHAGHTPEPVSRPEKALEIIGGYDALIANYTMPGMTGLEVARRAYAQGWRGSILLMSSDPAVMGESVEHPLLGGILHKPFSYETLLQAVLGLVPPRA